MSSRTNVYAPVLSPLFLTARLILRIFIEDSVTKCTRRKKLSKLPFTGLAYLFESCFLIPQLRDFLLAESAEVLSRQGIDFVLK